MPTNHPPPPIPLRILNEYVYCPRLAYLEWVQGEFTDNADTVDGRVVHRRVDASRGRLPPPDDVEALPGVKRRFSVALTDEGLGITGKMDLVEIADGEVSPVDTKRGRPPDVPERAWPPERVQVAAQILLLRAHGYRCDRGFLSFPETHERVEVVLDPELEQLTRETIQRVRELGEAGIPPPLVDSPKCTRCSLVSICLPDEVNALNGTGAMDRPLRAPTALGQSLYVLEPGSVVGKSGDRIEVRADGKVVEALRARELQDVQVFGNVQVTTGALSALVKRNVPVAYFSRGGWLDAVVTGMTHKNVELRREQYRAADDAPRCLGFARSIVNGKIRNARTLLRRNAKGDVSAALRELSRCADAARRAPDLGTLLGIEGAAARAYFQSFTEMLREDGRVAFDLDGRNRRPPKDPMNALLSFLYSMLTRDASCALLLSGLDPFLGLYHQARYGKPALALDLCEEFRPIVADSVAVGLLNNGELTEADFIVHPLGSALTTDGRKVVLGAYERRMRQTIRHPRFRYSIAYRQVLSVQARLMGRFFLGEVAEYPTFLTR